MTEREWRIFEAQAAAINFMSGYLTALAGFSDTDRQRKNVREAHDTMLAHINAAIQPREQETRHFADEFVRKGTADTDAANE